MTEQYEVTIFYKYTPVEDPEKFMHFVKTVCRWNRLNGRILIANEGINGTVEGRREDLDLFEDALRTCTYGQFEDVWFKASPTDGTAFTTLKVKHRSEILNIGKGISIDPNQQTGTHIEAEELHQWFENQEDFAIIDMRNDYEYAVGHFEGAIDPGTRNFRDLESVMPNLAQLKDKKVLTVCTYGIRCEKASGYLKEQGFKDVYQLHGGIGTYMKKYPGQHFKGSLYVFDGRMTEQFTDTYEVIGRCTNCRIPNEQFTNCAWSTCHKQIIACESCAPNPVYCSLTCETTHQPSYETSH